MLLTHTALDSSVTTTGRRHPRRRHRLPDPRRRRAAHDTTLPDPGDGRVQLALVDVAGDRVVLATQFANGRITIRDRHLDGTPRFLAADAHKNVTTSTGLDAPRATKRGVLGVRADADAVDLAAPSTTVDAHRAAVHPGAGRRRVRASSPTVPPPPCGPDPTARSPSDPDAGNSAPAADPGPPVENAAIGFAAPRRARRAATATATPSPRAGRWSPRRRAARGPSPPPTRCSRGSRWTGPARTACASSSPTATAREPGRRRHGVRGTALRRRPPHLVRPPLPLTPPAASGAAASTTPARTVGGPAAPML